MAGSTPRRARQARRGPVYTVGVERGPAFGKAAMAVLESHYKLWARIWQPAKGGMAEFLRNTPRSTLPAQIRMLATDQQLPY
ncbi:hypothetical protein IAQ61_001035 [Plenodomus lingam]|uniref:uncharacterized protein n=1 Tax=Leptosphaeria maculans TaxID=5022 RepID=UPI0033170EAC|nr:hypothetical protein IAQ61_001035 [Plenodomus lingam]